MAGPWFASGLNVIQLTFQDDVPQEGPAGSAQSAWAHAMSLITQEPFWFTTRWGRQSDNLRRVYILISWEQYLRNEPTKTPLNERTFTSLSSTLLPLLPYLSDTPRLVYLDVPDATRIRWSHDSWAALDIVYIRVTRDSDLEAFVDHLQFGGWILGSERRGDRNTGDLRASLRGWSEHGGDAVTMTYAIIIHWKDRDAANRFKDLTRPCSSRFDDIWGREVLTLFKELSSRGAEIEHVSVDFGPWPYENFPYHPRCRKKRALSLSSRCVVS